MTESVRDIAMIVVAAGIGERMGSGPAKAFRLLGGQPILARTLAAVQASDLVVSVVLVVADEQVDMVCEQWLPEAQLSVSAVVAGGARRQDSVRAGLEALRGSEQWVAVHDVARPCITPELITRLAAAAGEVDAVVPGWPLRGTIKAVDATGTVRRTVDRSELWEIQTPQLFRRSLLEEAHRHAVAQGVSATDDAALVEALDRPVKVIRGESGNVKITHPEDVELAEWWLLQRVEAGHASR